jgi:hypothetical protein
VTLHVRERTHLADAARRFRECAIQGSNLVGSSAGQPERLHVTTYLNWTTATELQLRNVFTELDIVNHLRSAAYWAIRNPTYQDFRVIELVNAEATEQAAWLEALAGQLMKLDERLRAAPGTITVVDTNVLLHYQRPDQIDWPSVIGADQVRLVIPLRVIEELDEKKYAVRKDDLPDRARRLLSQLWTRLALSAGAPVDLREKVTIEVPVDDGPRLRTFDADQEILDSCEQLRNVGEPVVLVTGDTGMSLRASALRLRVIRMPDDYLRNRPMPDAVDGA